jgi:hypothetical protein
VKDHAAIGPFWVRQGLVGNGLQLPSGYDLVFCVLSWESRCLAALPLLKGRGKRVIVIHFQSSNEDLEKVKESNLESMRLELGEDLERVLTINSSIDHIYNFVKMYECVEEESVKKRRPLNILFDMTCLAKRYLLYFLGLSFQSEFVGRLDYLYAEGKYEMPAVPVTGLDEFRNLVSQGNWELLQIPYFESREFTSDTDHDLFVSVGLEMQAVMEYVERVEPRHIRLYDLSDGDARVQESLLLTERPKINNLLALPNSKHELFELRDVVGMASSIASCTDRKVTCLAIGSKPHALAMGLAAIANRNIEVSCRVPVGYVGHDIPPLGPIHRFEIRDRFNPANYRNGGR